MMKDASGGCSSAGDVAPQAAAAATYCSTVSSLVSFSFLGLNKA